MTDFETAPGQLDTLVTSWAEGDQNAIDAVMNGQMRSDAPEVHDIIIVQRNERWAEEIADILDGSGTVFIAVGSGHLPGEQGVISLLRDRGIEVAGPQPQSRHENRTGIGVVTPVLRCVIAARSIPRRRTSRAQMEAFRGL